MSSTGSTNELRSCAYGKSARRMLSGPRVAAVVVGSWGLANIGCAVAISMMSGAPPWYGLFSLTDVVTFSFLTGWMGPLVVATAFGIYRGARPARREPIQDALLEGSHLTITAPRALRLDLGVPFAAVLGVGGGRASVRILADEGDVVLHANVSDRAPDGGTPEPRPLHFSMAGVPEHQLRFGDALLAALRAAAPRNRYAEARATLDAIERRAAEDPAIAVVDDGDEAESIDYRSSARPRPGEPGYARFVASEGREVCSGAVIAGPHVVIRCKDGVRRAFPIGYVRVDRVPGGLRASLESAMFEVELDVAHAEAIRRWLLDGARQS